MRYFIYKSVDGSRWFPVNLYGLHFREHAESNAKELSRTDTNHTYRVQGWDEKVSYFKEGEECRVSFVSKNSSITA